MICMLRIVVQFSNSWRPLHAASNPVWDDWWRHYNNEAESDRAEVTKNQDSLLGVDAVEKMLAASTALARRRNMIRHYMYNFLRERKEEQEAAASTTPPPPLRTSNARPLNNNSWDRAPVSKSVILRLRYTLILDRSPVF
jgi:hypothetical protein